MQAVGIQLALIRRPLGVRGLQAEGTPVPSTIVAAPAPVSAALGELGRRIGFRITPGFSERVIFRELFPRGLTLLDLRDVGVKGQMNISNVAARQELRDLMKALKLPGVTVDF